MPDFDDEINGIEGDDIDVIRTVFNVPEGETVTDAALTIKAPANLNDNDDTNAVLKKTISSGGGGIVNNTDENSAVMTFSLTSAETQSLGSSFLFFDVSIKLSDNTTTTPFKGEVDLDPDVTKESL